MSEPVSYSPGACDLETVIVTAQLDLRPSRRADPAKETAVLLKLQRELSLLPKQFFQKLVEAVLELSQASSSGISLLNQSAQRFVWPAVAGPFNVYIGEGTPSNFGPCGTVLERDRTLLMCHPERHFTYLAPINPGLEEVLLVPFYVDGQAVGTIWAVIHEEGCKFDAEDRRLLESLSEFAALAYKALIHARALEPLLKPKSAL